MARTEASEIGASKRRTRKNTPPPPPNSPPTPPVNPVGVEVQEPSPVSAAEIVLGHLNDHRGAADAVDDVYTFDLDYADQRGFRWQGSFTTHILTIRERAAVGMTKASMMNGFRADALDMQTLNIFEMQAHLAVSLDNAPDWAQDLATIRDVGVLIAIYSEVASHEARFWGAADTETGTEDAG